MASRPLRVQCGQADFVEAVDDVAHRVFVRLHESGDDRHTVPAGGGQQHHRASVAHRVGVAPPHDLLKPLPLLIGQSSHTYRLGRRDSLGRLNQLRPVLDSRLT